MRGRIVFVAMAGLALASLAGIVHGEDAGGAVLSDALKAYVPGSIILKAQYSEDNCLYGGTVLGVNQDCIYASCTRNEQAGFEVLAFDDQDLIQKQFSLLGFVPTGFNVVDLGYAYTRKQVLALGAHLLSNYVVDEEAMAHTVLNGTFAAMDAKFVSMAFPGGNIAYVAGYPSKDSKQAQLWLFDVSTAVAIPAVLGTMPVSGAELFYTGGYLFVSGEGSGALSMYSLANPSEPVLIETVPFGAGSLAAKGEYLYAVNSEQGLNVFQLTPQGLTLAGTDVFLPALNRVPRDLAVTTNGLYLTWHQFECCESEPNCGVALYDLKDPMAPVLVESMDFGQQFQFNGMTAVGPLVCLSTEESSSSAPSELVMLGRAETPVVEPCTSEDVFIGAPALEILIRAMAGVPLAVLQRDDLAGIDHLVSPNTGIDQLVGLQYLRDLKILNLSNNAISDLTWLAHLTKLKDINLANNQIEDIGPLAANTYLKRGVSIDLRGNPLGADALCTDIPALIDRGVYVLYDGECVVPAPDKEDANFIEKGIYYPEEWPGSIAAEKNILLVGSQQSARLELVDTSDPAHPKQAAILPLSTCEGGGVGSIKVRGTVAFAVLKTVIVAVDISQPRQPVILGEYALPKGSEIWFVNLQLRGNELVLSGGSTLGGYLFVIDAANPAQMRMTKTLRVDLEYGSRHMEVVQSAAVISRYVSVLEGDWLNVNARMEWLEQGVLTSFGQYLVVRVADPMSSDDYERPIRIYDLANPVEPAIAGAFSENAFPWRELITRGNTFAFGKTSNRVDALDVSNPLSFGVLGSYGVSSMMSDIAAYGDFVYVVQFAGEPSATGASVLSLRYTGPGSEPEPEEPVFSCIGNQKLSASKSAGCGDPILFGVMAAAFWSLRRKRVSS